MILPEVKSAIKNNYEEFLSLRKGESTRLAFIKLLKEYSGLGLKEAKDQADEIWSWDNVTLPAISVPRFEREFSIRDSRREKLEQLKKNLLVKEMASIILKKSEEELITDMMDMTSEEMENFLKFFI